MKFSYKNHTIETERTLLSGIVNVTPDSFSDGGQWFDPDKAVAHALALVEQGADWLDIGGESTGPGKQRVPDDEEIGRVVPVIERVRQETDVPISVDTWKAPVARAALAAGADIVNDVTGLLGDPAMATVIAETGAGSILMFNSIVARPESTGSATFFQYGDGWALTDAERRALTDNPDIVAAMKQYFAKTLAQAKKAGIKQNHILLDPGFGFGLTKRENLTLVKKAVAAIHAMGYPIFVGISRKRFVVNFLKEAGLASDPDTDAGFKNREWASAMLTAFAAFQGADVVRVHSIPEHLIARAVGDGVRLAERTTERYFGLH